MICPNCNGSKSIFGIFPIYAEHVSEKNRHPYIEFPCDLCDETGEIDDEYPARLIEGELLRKKRLDKELTFRDFCKKFNLSVSEVSAFERGKKLNEQITKQLKDIYSQI